MRKYIISILLGLIVAPLATLIAGCIAFCMLLMANLVGLLAIPCSIVAVVMQHFDRLRVEKRLNQDIKLLEKRLAYLLTHPSKNTLQADVNLQEIALIKILLANR